MSVAIAGEPSGPGAIDAMARLRDEHVPEAFDGAPAEVYVGGLTAVSADLFAIVDRYTPIVFAFVLGFSFIVLLLVFRSIVIPIKAVVMNLLSVGAAYGLLVLVFQKGLATDLLGFQHAAVIDAWIPLFLFTIVFGLSMDYHVFMLSRIRERYDRTGDNAAAVADGLRSTAGIITGARAHHGGGVRRLRRRPDHHQPAGGLRAGGGDIAGRDAGAVGPGAGGNGDAGTRQLVPAVVAELAAGPEGGAGRRESGCPAGCRGLETMRIPSAYISGYERARALDPDLARDYVAHTMIGDPDADAAMAALTDVAADEAGRLIRAAMDRDEDGLRDAPQALLDLFHKLETPPDWADPAGFAPGVRMFHRNSPLVLAAFVGAVLVEGFSTNICKSFFMTGRLHEQGIRRLKQNNRHMLEIFLPGGPGAGRRRLETLGSRPPGSRAGSTVSGGVGCVGRRSLGGTPELSPHGSLHRRVFGTARAAFEALGSSFQRRGKREFHRRLALFGKFDGYT